MTFKAKVESHGKTATGVEVPESVVNALAAGKRPAVKITINGFTYRNSIGAMGGRSLLSISADVRTKAGVQAGDLVEVHIELDTEAREVTVPPDLQQALDKNPAAKKQFEALSYSNKLRLVLPVEQAKAADTRSRRIDKIIVELSNT